MPTYNQASFIRRAIHSLYSQTFNNWELIIVNDGSTDNTEEFLQDFFTDNRLVYLKNERNEGLGAAINKALDVAKFDYIAYLPSDDIYFPDHLAYMAEEFAKNSEAVLVHTAIRWNVADSAIKTKNRRFMGMPADISLQLVQTAHRNMGCRWTERKEFVSDDLYKTFWHKLSDKGQFVYKPLETCQWTIHPHQRHTIMSEKFSGNINKYRSFYNIRGPIRYQVSDHILIDEVETYNYLSKDAVQSKDGLKILIVGELSYNPERIYALEEAGHQLYGLWTRDCRYSFSNVGPLPFGNIKDLDFANWENEVAQIKPDIIYAMLNSVAVPFCYEVMKKCADVPFVWHCKEGPFISQVNGTWDKLIALYHESDGQIFLNTEIKRWYEQFIPPSKMSLILDGDLPKGDIFNDTFSPKLSEEDGEIHTVVAGRMVGIDTETVGILAENGIHLHLYTESYEHAWSGVIKEMKSVAPNHFHVHHHVSTKQWVREFSKYDAGWLHCFDSHNYGNLSLCDWNDLNLPARISTMMAAGLPTIQKDNKEHIVAMQSCVRNVDCGFFYVDANDLARQLHNTQRIKALQKNVIKHRLSFTFDTHVQELTDFFVKVIKNKKQHN